MKKFILMMFTSLLFIACGDGSNLPKRGETAVIKKECLSAIDEEAYDEMTSICNAKNEAALVKMIANRRVYVLQSFMNATMKDYGFGKCKIDVEGVGEVWVASEFIGKKK